MHDCRRKQSLLIFTGAITQVRTISIYNKYAQETTAAARSPAVMPKSVRMTVAALVKDWMPELEDPPAVPEEEEEPLDVVPEPKRDELDLDKEEPDSDGPKPSVIGI